ncbi:MAG: 50S ribosomal protein L24 [Thermoplasmata archaeon]
MSIRSTQARRQRRAVFSAHSFVRRRRMTVPLSRELRARYHRRSLPLRKGDTVRIIGGSYVGREERVAKVTTRNYAVTLDNVTGKTADAKLKPLAVRPSQLVLTKLNLADPWRRRILKETEPEPDTADEGTPGPVEEPTIDALPPATSPTEPEAAEPGTPAPKRRRRAAPKAEEES